ncbi:hypothetical protein [Winogradskyella jejuensis]|uniref:Uncharacterized protein n=1 Tax=Winogradskyella jejuensis TaxID=1089305 RepID=A0A1M5LZ64_9FLAO|nr:hypothetical protein [Winogradskyella jejuensis]SHG70276.1 hypothetical protein SAMN05444148_0758 [Winogradskyella jejuensis]
MKKSILIITLLIGFLLSTTLMAQVQISGSSLNGIAKPKVECSVNAGYEKFKIFGNKSKNYTLVTKSKKIQDYTFTFVKTSGKAKATFTIFINGVKQDSWVFEGKIARGEKNIELNDVAGKEVTLIIKNNSATNKIEGNYRGTFESNSMLYDYYNPKKSDATIVRRITNTLEQQLIKPCNRKGTIEVVRVSGNSSAEIVVVHGTNVIKVVDMAANQGSRRINLTNLPNNNNQLKLQIRNIETNKFLKARIGAWFN